MLEFSHPDDPRIVYLDWMTDSNYLDSLRDIAAYRYAHELLRAAALPPERVPRDDQWAVKGPDEMIKNGALEPKELTRAYWRKSSYSGTSGTCVEVAEIGSGGTYAVRDSKNPTGPALAFTAAEWFTFTAGVRGGKFD